VRKKFKAHFRNKNFKKQTKKDSELKILQRKEKQNLRFKENAVQKCLCTVTFLLLVSFCFARGFVTVCFSHVVRDLLLCTFGSWLLLCTWSSWLFKCALQKGLEHW